MDIHVTMKNSGFRFDSTGLYWYLNCDKVKIICCKGNFSYDLFIGGVEYGSFLSTSITSSDINFEVTQCLRRYMLANQ